MTLIYNEDLVRHIAQAENAADILLDTAQASLLLNLAPSTLSRWRHEGFGPQFAKIGRRVAYRLMDLRDFVSAGLRDKSSRTRRRLDD